MLEKTHSLSLTTTKKEDTMSLKICARCGQTFRTEDTRTRYCSEECRHKATLEVKKRYRENLKARKTGKTGKE